MQLPQYINASVEIDFQSEDAFLFFECADNNDMVVFNRWTHQTDVMSQQAVAALKLTFLAQTDSPAEHR